MDRRISSDGVFLMGALDVDRKAMSFHCWAVPLDSSIVDNQYDTIITQRKYSLYVESVALLASAAYFSWRDAKANLPC